MYPAFIVYYAISPYVNISYCPKLFRRSNLGSERRDCDLQSSRAAVVVG